jgi:hypothetical protein
METLLSVTVIFAFASRTEFEVLVPKTTIDDELKSVEEPLHVNPASVMFTEPSLMLQASIEEGNEEM